MLIYIKYKVAGRVVDQEPRGKRTFNFRYIRGVKKTRRNRPLEKFHTLTLVVSEHKMKKN